MTEKSLFWYTNEFTGAIGDGSAPYTQTEMRRWQEAALGEGVLSGVDNELIVTAGASQVTVDTGRAQVAGFHYWNDNGTVIPVTTPVVGDTGGRVVAQANWTGVGGAALEARVRARVILNSDGNPAIPPLDQTINTTYEISLATFVIDTGGVLYTDASKAALGVTDTRQIALGSIAGMVKLREFTGDGTTNACTFDNIQQNLSNLLVKSVIRSDTLLGGDTLHLTLNNDGGNNYDIVNVSYDGASINTLKTTGGTSFNLGIVATSGLPNEISRLDAEVQHYTDSTFYGGLFSELSRRTATILGVTNHHGTYLQNASINRIDLTLNIGNYATGTKITLYGIR